MEIIKDRQQIKGNQDMRYDDQRSTSTLVEYGRPFFKSWLTNKRLYNDFSKAVNDCSYGIVQDLMVCWIYGKDYNNEFDVKSGYNIYKSDKQVLASVNWNKEKDEFWVKKKHRFDFYSHIFKSIKDGSLIKNDFSEKFYYDRAMAGGDIFVNAREVGLNI